VIDELPAERLLDAQIEAAEDDASEVEPVAQTDTKS
jgi:hypothetical protein